MALDKKQLQDDLYAVFTSMKGANQATDEDFANGIAKAVCGYIKGGKVVTDDGGTVSGGTSQEVELRICLRTTHSHLTTVQA